MLKVWCIFCALRFLFRKITRQIWCYYINKKNYHYEIKGSSFPLSHVINEQWGLQKWKIWELLEKINILHEINKISCVQLVLNIQRFKPGNVCTYLKLHSAS
jgi:hypothetical protein